MQLCQQLHPMLKYNKMNTVDGLEWWYLETTVVNHYHLDYNTSIINPIKGGYSCAIL